MRADQAAHVLVDLQYLEHAEAAAIAGAAAALAAARLEDRLPDRQPDRAQSRIGGKLGRPQGPALLAAVAQLSHQPLGDHRAQRRLEEESLDPEVEEARDRG